MSEKVILIIDDQDDLRFILKFDLLKRGYKAIEAKNGEKGIEIAKADKPDIILLDRKMPGLSGLETCKRLKADESTKNIPVLMLSGLSEKEEINDAIKEGAAGCIIKPFKFDDLIKRIIELIGDD